jgi:hypothetical protein
MTANTEAAIFDRVIRPDENGLEPSVAQFILDLHFQQEDIDRMNELAAKAREGTLTDDERAELDEYRRAGDVLALLHSKARRSLSSPSNT